MDYVIVAAIFSALGFVGGALVFHNNEKKGNQVVDGAQAVASDVSKVATTVAADVKKV